MPRYKEYDFNQTKMLPIAFDRQIHEGSFEYSLAYLIDHELNLEHFEQRYKNDDGGRPAYDPSILLKIILLAYSKGISSSRDIERLCRDNVIFMAISADSQPHWTTIADFVSTSKEAINNIFVQIVMICDDCGLIGREMFAIDGCKLPGNASKEWSGTKDDLNKKRKKIDRAVRRMLDKHKDTDQQPMSQPQIDREKKQIKTLRKASRKIKQFLDNHEDKKGVSGKTVQSNITDNDSAKMKTSHGVIQGYNGVASVDSKHQVIVGAKAYGRAQEHGLLMPMIEQSHTNLGHKAQQQKKTNIKITADAGYHNKDTLEQLEEKGFNAYVADTGFRSRDPRFKDFKRHKPKERYKPKKRFTTDDFKVNLKKATCKCPAGNPMWLKNKSGTIDEYTFMQFQAYESDCPTCPLKTQCLRNPKQSTPRQVNIKLGMTPKRKDSAIERMKKKIDSEKGRHIYSQRIGTVEPVFGHMTHQMGFKRFSLRGEDKVNGQWQLICLIHNIKKVHRYAWYS